MRKSRLKWYRIALGLFSVLVSVQTLQADTTDESIAVDWAKHSASYPLLKTAPVDEAIAAYKASQYEKAAKLFRLEADKGNPLAQDHLAFLYMFGSGVPQDHDEALKWRRKAADQGYAEAQASLGEMYEFGLNDVPKDLNEALKWYRLAAEQGNTYAENALGNAYNEGNGVSIDNEEAAKWYQKAADAGEGAAQVNLAGMYSRGEGVPQSDYQAMQWYLKAGPEHSDAGTMLQVALKYEAGKGVPQNFVEAYKWYIMAGAKELPKIPGYKDDSAENARKWAADLAAKMTPEQIAEAQKLATELIAKRNIPESPASTGAQMPPENKGLVSDIDSPSFHSHIHPENFALVVGIEKYQKLPAAEFAEHDAATMRKYLIAMGFPDRNIIYLSGENATRSRISSYLDEWLPKNVNEASTVFIYFSGHGAPSTENKQAYLMPWDSDAEFLKSTAFPLRQLYTALNRLKVKTKIVVLDACFSGTGGRSVLVAGTRPLVPVVVPSDDLGGVLLFAAASADQITGTLDAQGHGLFTYYFLKGLAGKAKDSSGVVTSNGLYRYLKPLVQDAAHRQNREQTPLLGGAQQDIQLASFR